MTPITAAEVLDVLARVVVGFHLTTCTLGLLVLAGLPTA